MLITHAIYARDRHCGYCHGSKHSSISMGFQCEKMSVDEYDKLINMGFRRSGTFIYKSDVLRTCCPMYTIRTSYEQFRWTKEHKHDVRKFLRALDVAKSETMSYEEVLDNLDQLTPDLAIRWESNEYSDAKYALFAKYQRGVHDDDECSPSGFKQFLCDSPLSNSSVAELRGSLHQCYYYKEQLIAIGVLDVLPSGLSSVYFMYDPDFKSMALGKISALLEMRETRTRLCLDYYYMGYYIQDCAKMKYKAKFGGELLNPLDNRYVGFHQRVGFWCFNGQDEDISSTYLQAETSRTRQAVRMLTRLGISYHEEPSTRLEFPTVVPGLVPLDRVISVLPSLDITVAQQPGHPIKVPFLELRPEYQRVTIDLYRLLGPELYDSAVLV